MKSNRYNKNDANFNKVLDSLLKEYSYSGGDPDAEVIINWSKREVKEDGVVSFYATEKSLSNAIKRARKNIIAVETYGIGGGATLFFDEKAVRPMHTILRIPK